MPLENLNKKISKAVSVFWETRSHQTDRQMIAGKSDRGQRAAVTGGAQMDGFVDLIKEIAVGAGISDAEVFTKKQTDLPGYFRPTKKWDFVVVSKLGLLAVIEAKSQIGPSFGNNFNNRTEEAIGSAVDLWTAYREGGFKDSPKPWVGYLFLLENCVESGRPVKNNESHFDVFEEFIEASYAKRYEIFCRKLVLERHYCAASLILSDSKRGKTGVYSEPAEDLSFERFARSLAAHLGAYAR